MRKDVSKAIILMNLGSPDSTSVPDVRRYLNEFLMDERVIDSPYLLRLLLVRGIITPFRAPKSAEAYQTIWEDEGSPLIIITRNLQQELLKEVQHPVHIMMRYGKPDPKTVYDSLVAAYPSLKEVIVVPMYPHYAMSSYETAVEYARDIHKKHKYAFKLYFVKPFYDEELYIDALAESMKPYLEKDYDHLLFSYHGIPERHLKKSDPSNRHCLMAEDCCNTSSEVHKTCYRHQCFVTTKLITERLNIPSSKYSVSFQSRLGSDPWLKPYTDFRLKDLPGEGVKKLLVICPAFVSDCLETLEEIAIRGKETFEEGGGEQYEMIPCLNTHPNWVTALANWIAEIDNGSTRMLLQ